MVVPVSAEARGSASVRFVHAVPAAEAVDASASSGGGEQTLAEGVAFGEVSAYRNVPAGTVELSVARGDGSDVSADTSEPLEAGRSYTVVALGRGERDVELRVYPDGRAGAGVARLRLIQAIPELGEPELRVGREVVASGVRYGDATPYRSIEPGTYTLAAARPGDGGDPIVSEEGVVLSAGTASTALLVGSAGERARLVVVDDSVATPAVAPATGLGGLASESGTPWLLVLATAALAGGLGGAGYRLATGGAVGRRRPRAADEVRRRRP